MAGVAFDTVQYSTVQYSTVQLGHLVGLLAGEGAVTLVRLVVELAVHRLARTVHHLERVGAVSREMFFSYSILTLIIDLHQL